MGFTGNKSKKAEKEKEEIDSRCIVKFRPADDWKGEYGFDWFREGDYGELLANGERNDGTYNHILVNGVRSNTWPDGTPVRYTGIAKTDYKNHNLVGKYGDIDLFTIDDNNHLHHHPQSPVFREKTIYYSIPYRKVFNGVFIFYLKGNNEVYYEYNNQLQQISVNEYYYDEDEREMVDRSNGIRFPVIPWCCVEYTGIINTIKGFFGKTNKCNTDPDYLLDLTKLNFNQPDGVGGHINADRFAKMNYSILNIQNNNKEYYVPYLSLFYENTKEKEDWGECEATVQLLIKAESGVKGIIFDCDRGITCSPVLIKFGANAPNKEHVKIALSKDFKNNNKDVYIRVKAIHDSNEETLAGKICVVKCIPKYVDVIFVPIPVRIDKGIEIGDTYFEHIDEQAGYLKRFLRQAHVIPNIRLACFKPKSMGKITSFIDSIKGLERINNQNPYYYILKASEGLGLQLGQKLEELFNKDYPNYRNAYKVFLIGVKGQNGLLGRANDIPSTAATIFKLSQDSPLSTICHELLHCFGLFHSFSNDSPYTFEKYKTSNIMDYFHPCCQQLLSSWKWQWEKIQAAKGIKLKEEPWNLKELPTVRIKE